MKEKKYSSQYSHTHIPWSVCCSEFCQLQEGPSLSDRYDLDVYSSLVWISDHECLLSPEQTDSNMHQTDQPLKKTLWLENSLRFTKIIFPCLAWSIILPILVFVSILVKNCQFSHILSHTKFGNQWVVKYQISSAQGLYSYGTLQNKGKSFLY